MKYINLCLVPNQKIFTYIQTLYESGEFIDGYYRVSTSEQVDTYYFCTLESIEIFFKKGYIWEILRCIYANTTYIIPGSLYKPWDIIIPNAYISQGKPPLFCEYAIWETYTFENFEVFLNGIVSQNISQNVEENYDVYDPDAYEFISYASSQTSLDTCVGIFEFQESFTTPEHLWTMLLIMTQE